jgi:uncharacterized protein YfaS (alpha-2-macroglobulin family)
MKKILILALLTLSIISCNKSSGNDNLYKFREYIFYTTSGRVSVSAPIQIIFSKDITQQKIGGELKNGIVNISPAVKGQYIIKDNRTIEIYPEKNLKPNTEYTVKIQLNKLFNKVPREFKKFQFQFKTIEPNFSINMGNIQSYSKEWQYLEGNLSAADVMSVDQCGNVLIAKQNGKNLSVKWQENSNTDFHFTIDSIQRPMEDSEVEITWNGKKAGIDNKGSQKIIIPGQNRFVILGVNVVQKPEQYLEVNFSDPLLKTQNFDGLVTIEGGGNLRFNIDGNVLKVYPQNTLEGNVKTEIFAGIESEDGIKLKENYVETVEFAQLKPEIRSINKGVILPDSKKLTYNFEAVNIKSVTVRVVKIFENNILQFLQDIELSSSDSYNIRKVGRRVAKKKITLIQDEKQNTGKWTAYAIDLAELIKTEPGAIYRVELSFDKDDIIYNCETPVEASDEEDSEEEYYEEDYYYDSEEDYTTEQAEDLEEREEQYWDNLIYNYKRYNYNWNQRENPCHSAYYNEEKIVVSNILASNIGLIVKRGQNHNFNFTVTDILTTEPIAGAKVTLYNFQKQEIASVKTNGEGLAELKTDANAYFAIASFNDQKTYLKINDGNSLSLSKFDVSGKEMKKGLKGYLYGERGVWRPGDTLHLTFVLNDKSNPIPKGHPVNFELRDARGQLVYKQVSSHDLDKFHKFIVPTNASAPTGNWIATVKVGGASFNQVLKIATVKPNRFKLNIDFNKGEVIKAKDGIKGTLAVSWLHGAIAKNVKVDVKMKLTPIATAFKSYSQYIFEDPTREYKGDEITIYEGTANAEGKANIVKALPATQSAPGMLKATFMTRAFEPGGDFSMDVFSKNVAPFSSFVGLLPAKIDNYGSYTTDKNTTFNIVSVTDEGKAIARKGLEIKVYKIDWRWWWSSSYDNVASYVSSQYHEQTYDKTVQTDGTGKASFTLKIPNEKGGRYLIRITDPVSGHATGLITYFYRDWWRSPGGSDDQSANMLVFATDKTKYNVGETAHLTFPSGSEGRALISIENGSGVVEQHWVKTKKGETKVDVPITNAMSPNVFINISLLQPHAITANDLPLRLYGVIPIMVEDPQTRLNPQISMPEVLKPEEDFTVKVSEKNGKAMTYTLAVVDEGLLDITRFKTPNVWDEFNQKQALGVTTWDIYDEVIGAYGGSIDQVFSIGGDEGAISKKGKKANRFKPVVTYLGPFRLEKGKTASHTIHMPNYVGSVRTMVVAGDNSKNAYGSVDKTTPVRKPLMLLASLPRKLSPSEKVTLPVTVFAMENKVKNVTVKVTPENGINILGDATQTLTFDKPDEKMLYFDLDVSKVKGIGKIKVTASGNGETASYEVEIDIVNPNPISNKYIDIELMPNSSQEVTFSTFGEPGTNTAQMEFSTFPQMDFNRRLQYLIQYPHGCVEQTTSSVFPQLYLSDLFDMSAQQKQNTQYYIKEGIKALGMFQNPDGGMGYWRGDRTADDWGTSYAGHFMLEAEKKGYALPLTFKTNWLKYQKQAAKTWRPTYRSYNTDLAQAYRLYTLALAGQPDLAAMNRLREFAEISNEGRWRLAGAYALAGQKEVAKQLVNQSNIEIISNTYDYYTYGSVDRNRAMAMETLLLINDKKYIEMSKTIARELSADHWMSTQSTAYSLLAMAKMVEKGGGKSIDVHYQLSSISENVKTQQAIALRTTKLAEGSYKVNFTNKGSTVIFIRVLYSGKLPVGEEVSSNRNLNVMVTYETPEGKPIDVSKLMQGTDFKAKVTITNTSGNFIDNVALTQVFPSGWEIINTDFAGYGTTTVQLADFIDIRDDRVNFYFDLGGNKSKTFEVDLNASYLGKYYRYGAQAEAMYNNEYFARSKGAWVDVIK